MKFKKLIPVLSFILFVFVGGCLDTIELDAAREAQNRIVIQGSLIMGNPSVVEVRISRLFDFTSSGREPVNVRFVKLIDEAGNELELEEEQNTGDYSLRIPARDPGLSINEDGAYFIRVSTFAGNIYESEPVTFQPSVPQATNLQARLTQKEVVSSEEGELEERPFVEFLLTTPLQSENGEDVYLRWVNERTYRITDSPEAINQASTQVPIEDSTNRTCYITEIPLFNEVPIADSRTFGDLVQEFKVYEEALGGRFAEGYYLTVYQQTISAEAHDYWSAVGALLGIEGTIFDPPVGQLISNLENTENPDDKPFGYFYAARQDTIRVFVSPQMVGEPDTICPRTFGMVSMNFDYCEAAPECCNCLSIDGSRLEQPDFWEE